MKKQALSLLALIILLFIFLFVSREDKWVTINKNNFVIKYNQAAISPQNHQYLFSLKDEKQAFLINGIGDILHSWKGTASKGGWYHVETNKQNDIYAFVANSHFEKLNSKSKKVWRIPGKFHHHFDFRDNGNILILERYNHQYTHNDQDIILVPDKIVEIDEQGKRVSEVSLFDIFKSFITKEQFDEATVFYVTQGDIEKYHDSPLDVFHTNMMKILKHDVPGIAKKGQILLSLPVIKTIAVVDYDTKELVWFKKFGDYNFYHDPSLTKDRELCFLENGGQNKKSKIICHDALSNELIFEYPPLDSYGLEQLVFFTEMRGSVQLLKGGMLITSTQESRAFEVNQNNEIIWDFYYRDGNTTDLEYRTTKILKIN